MKRINLIVVFLSVFILTCSILAINAPKAFAAATVISTPEGDTFTIKSITQRPYNGVGSVIVDLAGTFKQAAYQGNHPQLIQGKAYVYQNGTRVKSGPWAAATLGTDFSLVFAFSPNNPSATYIIDIGFIYGNSTGGTQLYNQSIFYNYTQPESEKISADIANTLGIEYASGDSASSVTKDVRFLNGTATGVTTTWSTSNKSVISSTGVVTRPTTDINVTVYADVRKSGAVGIRKSFSLTVKGTGGSPPSSQQPIKIKILDHNEAQGLLRYVSNSNLLENMETKYPDYYLLLRGELANRPAYERTVKENFIKYVFVYFHVTLTNTQYNIDSSLNYLLNYVSEETNASLLTRTLDTTFDESVEALLEDFGIPGCLAPHEFIESTGLLVVSLNGALNIQKNAEIRYLTEYLGLRNTFSDQNDEHFKSIMSTYVLELGINTIFKPNASKLLNEYAEYIYKLSLSIGTNYSTVIKVKCPVIVEVYDKDNNLIITLDNVEAGSYFTEFGSFYVIPEEDGTDFEKILKLNSNDYHIVIRGNGSGTMDYSVEKLDSSGNVAESYYYNNIVIDETSEFSSFTGTITPSLSINSIEDDSLGDLLTLSLSSIPQHQITVTHGVGGSTSCSETVNEGVDITLTAFPNAGYSFDGWYENNAKIPNVTENYSFTASSNRLLDARFSELQSIAITTPATKLSYTVGDPLDITGLVISGTYSDGSTKAESITAANITGFNSSAVATDRVLTIIVGAKTTTYKVQILATVDKTELVTAVGNAITFIESKTVGMADGQVPQAAYDSFQAAVVAATAVKDNAEATQAEVDAAVTALASATVTFTNAIIIDKTAPEITLSSPTDGTSYTLNQNVIANWTATDSLSGLDSAIGTVTSGSAITTSSVGLKSFTVTAKDKAGNQVTKTVSYKVHYLYSGVLSPLDNTGSYSFKIGSTIPVKFQLKDFAGKYVSSASATISYAKYEGNALGKDIEAVSTSGEVKDNSFRYASADNQYIFNLNTKGWAAGTYQLTIKLDDGMSYTVKICSK